MRDIVYIVRDDIVANMDNSCVVKDINGNDITLCNVKWAAVNKVVTDSLGNEYRITAVDYSTNIVTVLPLGAYVFTGNVLYLNTPYFFTGTPRATNSEWVKFTNDERKKTPFIWMVEPTKERPKDSVIQPSSIERESDLRIVFLDTNNHEKWLTLDTHDNRLQALYNMRTEFIRVIRDTPKFHDIKNSQARNITKFGTETSNGFEANIIDSNLTGIDCRLTLSILKIDGCNC